MKEARFNKIRKSKGQLMITVTFEVYNHHIRDQNKVYDRHEDYSFATNTHDNN